MAFSSLYQPYIQGQEMPVSGRKREDGALKRYESVEDFRAWSMDPLERSTFIHDMVKRREAPRSTSSLVESARDMSETIDEDYAEKVKNLLLEVKVNCDFVFLL
jgi:hypothetical protein